MRTAWVVVLTALAVMLAGCSPTIKPDRAANSVTDLVSQRTGFKPTDVTCPDGVAAKKGATFQCKFTGPEGVKYTADMRVTKVEGEDVEFFIETTPTK